MICFSLSTEHGSGHHDELVAADFDAVHLDGERPLLELLADELVRRRDAHGALHPGRGFERFQAGGDVAHAHHADHHALLALDGVDLVAELRDALANVVDFFLVAWGRIEMTMTAPSKTKSPLQKSGPVSQIHQRLTQPTPLYRIWLNQNR
jgi:hypothetical protein